MGGLEEEEKEKAKKQFGQMLYNLVRRKINWSGQEALSDDRKTMFRVEVNYGRLQRGRNEVTVFLCCM